MKKQKRLSRVDIQAFILTAVMVVLSCILIFSINYTLSYKDMIDSLQDLSLIHIYTSVSLFSVIA